MSPSLVSAPLSVDGTHMQVQALQPTNLLGLVFPLPHVTAMHKRRLHLMEILLLMLPSVSLVMNWLRLQLTQLEVDIAIQDRPLHALALMLWRMEINVLGTSQAQLGLVPITTIL
jgi:hypothetical protein